MWIKVFDYWIIRIYKESDLQIRLRNLYKTYLKMEKSLSIGELHRKKHYICKL